MIVVCIFFTLLFLVSSLFSLMSLAHGGGVGVLALTMNLLGIPLTWWLRSRLTKLPGGALWVGALVSLLAIFPVGFAVRVLWAFMTGRSG